MAGCLPYAVHAYSSGPPSSACSSASPSHGAGQSSGTGGFSITLKYGGSAVSSYVPGEVHDVVLARSSSFKGFLLQAYSGSTRVGAFSGLPSGTRAPCFDGSKSVSHSSSSAKTSLTFKWTAPGAGSGTLTFKGTGVSSYSTWYKFTASVTEGAPPPDTTPPTFGSGYPSVASPSHSSFSVQLRLSEPGAAHAAVVARGAAAPSVSQVVAGTVAGAVKAGSVSVASASTTYTIALSGLAGATDFDVYVAAADSAGNNVAAAVKLQVSTCSAACSACSGLGSGADACTSCASGNYDTGSTCMPCAAACTGATYESTACTGSSNRVCSACHAACKTCTAGGAASCAATSGGGRDCAAGHWASGGTCVACSAACGSGKYESKPCTAAQDRECREGCAGVCPNDSSLSQYLPAGASIVAISGADFGASGATVELSVSSGPAVSVAGFVAGATLITARLSSPLGAAHVGATLLAKVFKANFAGNSSEPVPVATIVRARRSGTVALDSALSMSWASFDDASGAVSAAISMTLTANAWIGWGISPGRFMVGLPFADAVVARPVEGTVRDMYMKDTWDEAGVRTDSSDELSLTFQEQAGGTTRMWFTRKFATGDSAHDHPITLQGTTPVVYAYGQASAWGYHEHHNRGIRDVAFLPIDTVTPSAATQWVPVGARVLTITGVNFGVASTVTLTASVGPAISVAGVRVSGSTSITVKLAAGAGLTAAHVGALISAVVSSNGESSASAAVATVVPARRTGSVAPLGALLTVSWSVFTDADGDLAVSMDVAAARQAWVGVGVSPSGAMVGPPFSDAVVALPATGEVRDAYLASKATGVSYDSSSHVANTWAEASGGTTEAHFTRKLDTGDSLHDQPISATAPTTMVFAVGASTSLAQHAPGDRAVAAVDVFPVPRVTNTSTSQLLPAGGAAAVVVRVDGNNFVRAGSAAATVALNITAGGSAAAAPMPLEVEATLVTDTRITVKLGGAGLGSAAVAARVGGHIRAVVTVGGEVSAPVSVATLVPALHTHTGLALEDASRGASGMSLSWSVFKESGGQLMGALEVVAATRAWMALGVSKAGTMVGADAVVARPGPASVSDSHITAKAESGVVADASQDVSATWLQQDATHTRVWFSRRLDTGDSAHDQPMMPAGPTRLVFALGGDNTFAYHAGAFGSAAVPLYPSNCVAAISCSGHGTCKAAAAGAATPSCACSRGYTGSTCGDCVSPGFRRPSTGGGGRCVADAAKVRLTLAMDFSTVGAAGSAARQQFEEDFVSDVAAAANVTADRVRVLDVKAGSVIVLFEIAGTDDASAADVATAVTTLEALVAQGPVPGNPLFSGKVTANVDASAGLTATFESAADSPEQLRHTVSLDDSNGVSLAWTVHDAAAGTITLEVSAAASGASQWLGLAVAADTRMIAPAGSPPHVATIGQPSDGSVAAYELRSKDVAGVVKVDATTARQALTGASVRHAGGRTHVRWTRTLKGAGGADAIKGGPDEGPTTVLWAVGSAGGGGGLNAHAQRGAASVDFGKGVASKAGVSLSTANMVHGALMAASWGVLLPLGAVMARFFKHDHPWRFFWHRRLQVTGFVLGLAGFGVALVMVDGAHFSSRAILHSVGGCLVTLLGIAQVANAVARPHPDPASRKRALWFGLHRCLGWSATGLGLLVVLLGIVVAELRVAYLIAWGGVVLLLVCVAIAGLMHRNRKQGAAGIGVFARDGSFLGIVGGNSSRRRALEGRAQSSSSRKHLAGSGSADRSTMYDNPTRRNHDQGQGDPEAASSSAEPAQGGGGGRRNKGKHDKKSKRVVSAGDAAGV